MQRSGTADMALWGGGIPPWLFSRMKALALPMVQSLLLTHGQAGFLSRLADPFWFQSFGAVIGMDWNSSGVTTAVMRALKEALHPHARELGLYVCGGKGSESRKTPLELLRVGDATGMNGTELAHYSRLTAKVDNTAIQDGFQLYLHSFVLSVQGDWTVVQQGMEGAQGLARRYHWHSAQVTSFVEEPHTAICGENQGLILNLTDKQAGPTQDAIMAISRENPDSILKEIPRMKLPDYCDLRAKDVDLKRLGGVLRLAQAGEVQKFEDLLLLQGLGPRTLQSLTLVSEVIHGTPSRFADPARFAFAHGGKSGTPFPVPTRVYDETIVALKESVEKARMGDTDKLQAIKKLSEIARKMEERATSLPDFDEVKRQEQDSSHLHGGRSIRGHAKAPGTDEQLKLF